MEVDFSRAASLCSVVAHVIGIELILVFYFPEALAPEISIGTEIMCSASLSFQYFRLKGVSCVFPSALSDLTNLCFLFVITCRSHFCVSEVGD